DAEKAKMKKKGYEQYTADDRKRLQTAKRKKYDWEKLEEGRKQQGGFTGSTADLELQLREERRKEERRKDAESEPKPVEELSDDEVDELIVDDEAKEWHKRDYVASDEELFPLPIPDEVALPYVLKYLELEQKMNELREQRLGTRLKSGSTLEQVKEHAKCLLPIMEQETKTSSEMKKLEAYFKKNGIRVTQLEAIIRRSKEKAVTEKKPIETAKRSAFKPHGVYEGREYPTAFNIGGTGVGGVASAMEPGRRGLRFPTRPQAGEQDTAPERTNEEAVFADIDRDLAKENTPEKLLRKLFYSEHFNEEDAATILADKTFLQALEIEKWDGNLSVLKRMVGEISLEKSDELLALEQKKGWLKRLFKSPEEKLMAKQMRALDNLIKVLLPGSKEPTAAPETKKLLRTISKR
ncbi:MAG: hypothetical protein HY980_00620, partial [Candidatus Magasanikbacteria bacterium]|nr:hypothetical protein [Candidatus Magasanikbacteria bacterium]